MHCQQINQKRMDTEHSSPTDLGTCGSGGVLAIKPGNRGFVRRDKRRGLGV